MLLEHLDALHAFYGAHQGVRVARKHLGWYCRPRAGGEAFWRRINRVECPRTQRRMVATFLDAAAHAPALGRAA